MNLDEITVGDYLEHYTKPELELIAKGLVPLLLRYDQNLVQRDAQRRLFDEPVEFFKSLLSITAHFEINYKASNINHVNYRHAAVLQSLKDELVKTRAQHIDILFKFPGTRCTIEDHVVSAWIREKLIQCFDDFDISSEFGDSIFLLNAKANPMQDQDRAELLRSYAKRPLSFAKVVNSFCESIINYLNLKFALIPHEAKLYSEQQISFLYELLGLMSFEGFEDTFDADCKPEATDIDRLYQMLNYQQRINR
jgi:hypothetical protein